MKPLVLGYVQASHLPARLETALTGQLATWAVREGYLLGDVYRETAGNDAFPALLQAIQKHGAAGVIVPSFAHLGPEPERRVAQLRAVSGAQVFAVGPTPARGI
jgi:hypothetical protein